MNFEEKEPLLEEEADSIDILEIVNLLKDKIAWIAAFALLGAVIAYAYSCFFITPMYTASVVMYVNNRKTNAYVESVSTNDITASSQLVPTYQAIVSTKTAMKRAIDEGGIVGYTPEQLLSMISTQTVEDTGIFQITVRGKNQYDVADIANAVAQSGTKEITKYIEGTTVSIIDYAITPEHKSSPSNKRNAMMGFLIGAILCIAAIIGFNMFDTRIKKTEDFAKELKAPVLGVIPNIGAFSGGGDSGKTYSTSGNSGGKQ
ncbi:MAG: YveK family protein [Clostridia bacterium]